MLIDGDTFDVAAAGAVTRIRLWAIDAFEAREVPLGVYARAALAELVAGREVSCTGVERDRYKRLVAVCSAGGVDLSGALLRAGYARIYPNYAWRAGRDLMPLLAEYETIEGDARRRRVGVWVAYRPPTAD